MRAIKQARRLIQADPTTAAAQALSDLILALEAEATSPIKGLYQLSPNDFDLAIQLLKDWRLDRFYEGKAKAFDVAYQAQDMKQSARSRPLSMPLLGVVLDHLAKNFLCFLKDQRPSLAQSGDAGLLAHL